MKILLQKVKDALADAWGITNTQETKATLDSLLASKASKYELRSYAEMYEYLEANNMLSKEYINGMKIYRLEDMYDKDFFRILLDYKDSIIENGGISWNYHRVFLVATYAYDEGYLTESEMDSYMKAAEAKIDETFNDDRESLVSYLMGYNAWAGMNADEHRIAVTYSFIYDLNSPLNVERLKEGNK